MSKDGEAKNERRRKFISKRKNIIIGIVTVILITCGGLIAYASSIRKTVDSWNDKIYPGVTVEGVNIGGKNREEAKEILEKEFGDKINEKEIIVTVKDKEYKNKYSSISPKYNIDKTVDNAMEYGKDDVIFKRNSLIKNGDSEKHEIALSFTYDNEKLNKLEDEVIKKFNIPAKDATLNINGGKISIVKGEDGFKINKELLDKELKEKINGNLSGNTEVQAEYVEDKPKVTEAELSKINGIMGTFSSAYKTSDANRCANIAAATSFVNGTILMPGETFSYSEITQRDKSKYKEANAYINNQVKKDIGGGICQVSSTLYRAAMRANIRPTERHNHSMTVGYAKPGLDATVAWGYLDYKFKNPYDFPIYIQGITHDKVVTFNIYGDTNALDGKTYDMTNEIVKTIAPTEEVVQDPNLEEGKRINEGGGITGYVAKGYQITYKDGKEIKKELVSTDTYKMIPNKVKVGTKKPEVPQTQPDAQQTPTQPEGQAPKQEDGQPMEAVVPAPAAVPAQAAAPQQVQAPAPQPGATDQTTAPQKQAQ